MGLWSTAKCGLDNTERRMEHPKKKGARMLMTREISSRAHNLLSVKHATTHRKRIGDKKSKNRKDPGQVAAPVTLSSQHAPKDQRFSCVETATWPENGLIYTVPSVKSTKKISRMQKTSPSWWEKKVANPRHPE